MSTASHGAGHHVARRLGRPTRATLVGHRGVGVLQVWRGRLGQKMAYAGTWRHELEDGHDPGVDAELERAMREHRPVPFEGALDDPGQPGLDMVSAEVLISSISSYAYLVDPEDPASRRVDVTVVNFRPKDELPGV